MERVVATPPHWSRNLHDAQRKDRSPRGCPPPAHVPQADNRCSAVQAPSRCSLARARLHSLNRMVGSARILCFDRWHASGLCIPKRSHSAVSIAKKKLAFSKACFCRHLRRMPRPVVSLWLAGCSSEVSSERTPQTSSPHSTQRAIKAWPGQELMVRNRVTRL